MPALPVISERPKVEVRKKETTAPVRGRRVDVETVKTLRAHHEQLSSARAAEDDLGERLVAHVEKDSPDVHLLCRKYGLRREELARLTGFSLRALADWASDKMPSQPAVRRLTETRRLLDALAEIVSLKAIPDWLRRPNPALDHLTPLQVIELGQIDRLWAMVYERASGAAT